MKIPPDYKLTPDLIDLIAKIEANRIFLNSINIPTVLKNKIERVSLLKSSLYSARIEGNPLSINDYSNSPEKLKKKEITNIIKTIKFIELELKESKLNLNIIKQIHNLVLDGLSPETGLYRREVSAIFNTSGIAVYMPPPPSMIEELMQKMFLYQQSTQEKYHLITAFISHLIFEKIHPFLDGNGRVGRLLIFAILKNKGWNFPLFVPIEEYFDAHKDEYYYHLDTGMQNPENYLQFMLQAFYQQSEDVKKQLSNEQDNNSQILLPPRQEEIYRIIRDHDTVSLDFIKRRFLKIPSRTLRYDLEKLMKHKLIIKIGKTKGSFYKVVIKKFNKNFKHHQFTKNSRFTGSFFDK